MPQTPRAMTHRRLISGPVQFLGEPSPRPRARVKASGKCPIIWQQAQLSTGNNIDKPGVFGLWDVYVLFTQASRIPGGMRTCHHYRHGVRGY
jgi:hypothetical protein